METNELLSKKQIFLSRLILGIAAVVLGVFLLLCGLDVLKIPIQTILFPAACFAAALVCIAWAFIQDNTLTLWLAPALIIVGLVSVLVGFTDLAYANLYPLYILAPAVSCAITAIYSKNYSDHLKYIVFFAISAILFSLNAFFDVSLAITIPAFIVFVGIAITIYTVTRNKK